MIEKVRKCRNIFGIFSFLCLTITSCEQGVAGSKNHSPEELTFELISGEWDLQKTVKGREAINGGVTLDYITKTMTLETNRFNTYTTSHIPWGSKYQSELIDGVLSVFNGTQTTYFTFKVTASRDGKRLILENINNGDQEFYTRKK
jgi:hypothetical protein